MLCFKQNLFVFRLLIFILLLLISFPLAIVHSADVVLLWDRPDDYRVIGYKIYHGLSDTDFKSESKEIITSPEQTSCNIYDLKSGNTYGFAAKSFDKNGNESVFSEVIYYDAQEAQDAESSGDEDRDNNVYGNSHNSNNNNDASEDNNTGGSGGGGCFFQTILDLNTLNY